jgi:hypothetical protein
MKIQIVGYITHKEAEQYSDCADRYAVNREFHRFAIADGVSKSFFPDIWADILVNNFVKNQSFEIEDCRKDWYRQVETRVNSIDAKWFTRNAFVKREPGLATFVNLWFEDGKWFAEALGDSFLFFIPHECGDFEQWIKLSSKPEDNVVFDSYPDYYSSYSKEHGEKQTMSHDLKPGTFYLMTDALSEWVFKEKEKAIQLIGEKWTSQSEYEDSIKELRKTNRMNNDDSAILIIKVEDDGQTTLTYVEVKVQDLKELIEKDSQQGIESPMQSAAVNLSDKEKKDIDNAFNDIKKQMNHVFTRRFPTKKYNEIDKKRLEQIVLTKIKEEYVISVEN